MNEEKKQGCSNGFVVGFVLGALAGVVAFFLLGTKKGREIKKRLQEKGGFSFKNLDELLKDFEEKGREFKEKASAVTQQLEEKTQTASQAVAQEAQKELDHIQKLQNQGRTIAKRFFRKNGRSLK